MKNDIVNLYKLYFQYKNQINQMIDRFYEENNDYYAGTDTGDIEDKEKFYDYWQDSLRDFVQKFQSNFIELGKILDHPYGFRKKDKDSLMWLRLIFSDPAGLSDWIIDMDDNQDLKENIEDSFYELTS